MKLFHIISLIATVTSLSAFASNFSASGPSSGVVMIQINDGPGEKGTASTIYAAMSNSTEVSSNQKEIIAQESEKVTVQCSQAGAPVKTTCLLTAPASSKDNMSLYVEGSEAADLAGKLARIHVEGPQGLFLIDADPATFVLTYNK